MVVFVRFACHIRHLGVTLAEAMASATCSERLKAVHLGRS
jgi:hypothetical protein